MLKKVVPFAGFCAALLAIVAVVLMMTSKSVILKADTIIGSLTSEYTGVQGIFGQKGTDSQPEIKASIFGLVGFFLLVGGAVCGLLMSMLPLIKKGEKVLSLLVLLEVPSFCSANELKTSGKILGQSYKYVLSSGWVFAGIISIVSGLVSALPTVAKLLK